MIANRLNVRPVKVKLPPGANHAYVTFRYSAIPFLLNKKKNMLQYTYICNNRQSQLLQLCHVSSTYSCDKILVMHIGKHENIVFIT